MTLYYVIGAILMVAALRPPWTMAPRVRLALMIVLAVFPALLAGFRGEECCRDYVVYRDYYSDAPDSLAPVGFITEWQDSLGAVDVLYVFVNSLLKATGCPFEGLILIVALASVALTVSAYAKSTAHPLLALALYYVHPFFYREMIQIRAGLACGLALWSYVQLANHRRRAAALVGVLAIGTHLSAAIAIIPAVLFLAGVRPRLQVALTVLAVAYGASLFINPELGIFATIERVAVYVNSEYAGEVGVFTNPTTMKQVVILIMALVVWRRWGYGDRDRIMRLCLLAYGVSTAWMIAFNRFEIIGARGASFVSFVEPVIVANIVWRFRDVRPALGALANSAAVAAASLIMLLNLEVKNVVDRYTTWW